MLNLSDMMNFFVTTGEEKQHHDLLEKQNEEERLLRAALSKYHPQEQIERLHKKVSELQIKLRQRGGHSSSKSSWSAIVPKVIALSSANKTMETFAKGHLEQQKHLTIKRRNSSKRLEHRLSLRKMKRASTVVHSNGAFSRGKSPSTGAV